MDPLLHIGLLVVLLVCGVYGVVAKDWRANFGSLAIGLFLLILIIVARR